MQWTKQEWSTVTSPAENSDSGDNDGHAGDLHRIHGLVKNNHRQDGNPDVAQRDQRIEDGELTMAERVDQQHGEDTVQKIAGKQLWNGQNTDERFEQASMAQLIRAQFDQNLRGADHQRASQHDVSGLPPL